MLIFQQEAEVVCSSSAPQTVDQVRTGHHTGSEADHSSAASAPANDAAAAPPFTELTDQGEDGMTNQPHSIL